MVKDIKPGHPLWEMVWERSRPGENHVSHLNQLFEAMLALRALLETHCCDSGEANYVAEWENGHTVCTDCRQAHKILGGSL